MANKWKIPLFTGLAALAAALGTLMYVSNFTAYLGNDPATCNNCHVMDAVYEGWFHSSHREFAVCNDCHTPHALIPKYWVKMTSGMGHVTMFALNQIPNPLRAKESTDGIIQANCIRCHQASVADIADGQMDSDRYCFACHRSVAHGERGISILPYQDSTRYR